PFRDGSAAAGPQPNATNGPINPNQRYARRRMSVEKWIIERSLFDARQHRCTKLASTAHGKYIRPQIREQIAAHQPTRGRAASGYHSRLAPGLLAEPSRQSAFSADFADLTHPANRAAPILPARILRTRLAGALAL